MPKKRLKTKASAMKEPIGRPVAPPSAPDAAEGSSLAHLQDVARKTAPSTLAFKPGAKRKSLIEWNPSRQAQILDWHHRAKDYGLAVEEREEIEEGQPYEV